MFVVPAVRSALEALQQDEFRGNRAHALGSASYSVQAKLEDFRLAMDLIEKQMALARPLCAQEAGEETLLCTRTAIHDQVTGLGLWLRQSRLYRYELVRQACNEIKTLQYVDDPVDEDNFYVSTDFLLVSISRPKEPEEEETALVVEICVNNAQQQLISRMEAECRELHRAIEAEDLGQVVAELKHIVSRARTLPMLRASEVGKLDLLAEFGMRGKPLLPVNLPSSSSLPAIELNYEISTSTGTLMYVLQIRPPLAAVARIAHAFATPEQSAHRAVDLLALLQAMDISPAACSSRVITQHSARFGKSIGLYSLDLEGKAGGVVAPAPLFGRLESADQATLETLGAGFVRRQHLTNALLASCFRAAAAAAAATPSQQQDEAKVQHLYTVRVACYPGGLLLKVSLSAAAGGEGGGRAFDVYVDVDSLSVSVEEEGDNSSNNNNSGSEARLDRLTQTMSQRLQDTLNVPEILHLCVAVFASSSASSASPRDAKCPRLMTRPVSDGGGDELMSSSSRA